MTRIKRHVRFIGVALLAAAAAGLFSGWAGGRAALAQAGTTVQAHDSATLGQVLAGSNGMTLYTFDRDTPGTSNCSGGCATTWPPLTIDSGDPAAGPGVSGSLSVITRQDGSRQVALNNQPLYFYAPDTAPGETKGDGVGGVWHVIKLSTASAPAAQAGPGPAPSALPRAGTGITADAGNAAGWSLGGMALAALAALTIATVLRRERRA